MEYLTFCSRFSNLERVSAATSSSPAAAATRTFTQSSTTSPAVAAAAVALTTDDVTTATCSLPDVVAMGRKKIQISPIADERNRQVSI